MADTLTSGPASAHGSGLGRSRLAQRQGPGAVTPTKKEAGWRSS